MSSLRELLFDIPHNLKHHPEGGVWRHCVLVRKSLTDAVRILRAAKVMFSCLLAFDFEFTKEEIQLAKLGAWMHDIGKSQATTLCIDDKHIPYSPELLRFGAWGRWQAVGHEQAKFFKPAMRKLGPMWKRIWDSMTFEDKKDLFFVIKYHMSLNDRSIKCGFGVRLSKQWIHPNGCYINRRRFKILLAVIVMDRLGRKVDDPVGDAWDAIYALVDGSKERLRRLQPCGGTAAPDDPLAFVRLLKDKPSGTIRQAFKGKFGRELSEIELNFMRGQIEVLSELEV